MKICLVTNLYEPYSIGGADIYVKWLARALMRYGHEAFVVTTCPARESFPGVKREKIDGILVYRFYPLNIYWGYLAQRKPLFLKPFWHTIELWNPHVYLLFRRILNKELPEVVHINNMGGLSNAVFWACRGGRRRIVYTLHDYISVCPKSVLLRSNMGICDNPHLLCSFYQAIKRWNLKRTVDVFTAPSQFVIDMHQKYNLLARDRCSVVPHGVDVTTTDINELNRLREERERTSSINILYVGRVDRHKGLSVLIHAFKKADRENLRLHIAGSGDYMDEARHELEDCGRVTFHGWVSGSDKREVFSKSDVCVLPSICYEAAGLVILEAYKYGLPVIGSRIGGIPEMINENETGFLFEPGDESGLALIFQGISKARLVAMASNCQQAAMSYSMENHVEKLMSIYSSLAGSSRREREMLASTGTM